MSTHQIDQQAREAAFRAEEARLTASFHALERVVELGRDLYVQDGLNEFEDKLADAEHADELLRRWRDGQDVRDATDAQLGELLRALRGGAL